ncbi:hypothetical protein NE235_02420 [Actinoallomurus spadix]|uniref:DUF3644 domain-containing protein n=1 Tax=Actinoallomurus spadix TaxID=79912 RepID=A0ABP3HC55_9ACTN|nr:DUF3644 domain-containing protein [Actinoallomurus spadix]MCO5984956.1 hypothetical protein [Actinoallomurus spadix]
MSATKKEVRLLKCKAQESLILSVDHFNRVGDVGRPEAVLVLLDRGLELILKASLLHCGAKIRERRDSNTIGFDACVRRAYSGANRFLDADQAIGLQAINGLRNAAQHYLLDISEEQLYIHAMSGVTLFRGIVNKVFAENLADLLPRRALPLSTVAPAGMAMLFANEVAEVRKLMRPGTRRRTEASVRLRPLAILDSNLRGVKLQPSEAELHKLANRLAQGVAWEDVFPGAAAVELTSEGAGATLSLRITKKEGIPVQVVPEGTVGESVIAVKKVNELDFYNLGHKQIAAKVGLTQPKLTALIRLHDLESDPDLAKELRIGSSVFKRYSQNIIPRIRQIMQEESIHEIWERWKLSSQT